MRDERGYYEKFTVIRNDTGDPVEGFRFVLLPDHDPHAVAALRAYADSCEAENEGLARDLRALLSRLSS